MGADEFIYGRDRWCLWLSDYDLNDAIKIPFIEERIKKVKTYRLKSKDIGARKLAERPHQFREFRASTNNSLIIPSVTSEGREYIPMGYLEKDNVVTNRAHVVLDAPVYIFGVLTSKMHKVWVNAVAGRLESRINYSSTICYNNFPLPTLTERQKQMISTHVFEVLAARENHSEKTLAKMYDPDIMPEDLRLAHKELDEVVDLCYRSKSFESDEERLSYLFKLYEEMIQKEKGENR